ncbi:cobalbumin biosynthesis protein [Denitrovibrio acetiphilus DSM 12809]|uniref:Adenosylcobinamide kinase n=2 Tax=Denitrovibrio TaxID=117999 RepID=D4H1X5_DENA2|nr:cobalbumin biosynthesis protein [Denitrovibrio acetiphilus DSM 12809]
MITGGAGAGKTAHALTLAAEYGRKLYVATAESTDEEMQVKIDAHKAERDETYQTAEEPLEIHKAVNSADADVVIIDCLTFWVNNLMHYGKDYDEYFEKLMGSLKRSAKPVIIVTNEVGFGIIPWDKETRLYAKLLSKINKQLARSADNVIMMVSGLELRVK